MIRTTKPGRDPSSAMTALRLAIGFAVAVGPAMASNAWAEDDSAKSAATDQKSLEEILIVGRNNPAVAAAPAQSSLAATAPQSIISEDWIQNAQPRTADFMSLLQISPSAGGLTSANGPGLGEAKTTLRGFKDGEYNITFDAIPFGDTNDPTHHSTSFFPASDISQIVIERGPGNADNLGQATFGGTVNLISTALKDQFAASQSVTVGSWNTYNLVTNLQSGALLGDHKAHVLFTAHEISSDGYLTNSPVEGQDQMLKGDITFLSGKLHLTGLVTHDWNTYYQVDGTSGLLAPQVAVLGKSFGPSNNPQDASYFRYNYTKKQTWFTYARAEYQVNDKIKIEDTPYWYWYDNSTQAALNGTASVGLNATNIVGTGATLKEGDLTKLFTTDARLTTSPSIQGIQGYDKLNHYGVYGNILKGSIDFGFGTLLGGVWSEYASTDRHQFQYDVITKRTVYQTNPPSGTTVPGNITYLQHSSWTQSQPFVEFEWRPTDALTITPGAKWVTFRRRVNAPVNQTSRVPTVFGKDWNVALPFLTVNYKLQDTWSVYGQWAQGFLAPYLNTTYVAKPGASSFNPQLSTNYQIGTVYRRNNLTLDADFYRVEFTNKVVSFAAGTTSPVTGLPLTDATFFNIGGAYYDGFEAQGTYSFTPSFAVFANGSRNNAQDVTTKLQITGAPRYTHAYGLLYNSGPLRASLTNKVVGSQLASNGNQIRSLETTDFNASYKFLKHFEVTAGIYNIFDSTDISGVSGSLGTTTDSRRYTFQAGRSWQIGAKVSY